MTLFVLDDGFNRLKQVDEPEGRSTYYSDYDNLDNLLEIKDPRGAVTNYTYDTANRLELVELPSLSSSLAGAYSGRPSITATYDKRGLAEQVKELASGETHVYTYDGAGRTLSYQDPVGATAYYTYDQAGNLLTESDFNNILTRYTYDGLNRRTSVEDRAGHTTDLIYDLADNLTKVEYPSGGDASYGYDALNRMKRESRRGAALSLATVYEYNLTGAVTSVTDENGVAITNTYDGFDRLRTTFDGVGTSSYTYDQAGNVKTFKDALNRVTTNTYDQLNRLYTSVQPMGKSTTYGYDTNHNQTSILDANANTTRFEYDAANRLIKHILPTSQSYEYGYDDESGRVVTRTPNGVDISATYDALDRLDTRSYNNHSYDFDYDANSNLEVSKHVVTGVAGISGTWEHTYTYDARDLLQSVTAEYPGAPPRTTTYTDYTASGALKSYNNFAGRTITHTLDPNHELPTAISGSFGTAGAVSGGYSYDDALRLAGRTTGNGTSTTLAYDARNLLIGIVATRSSNSHEIHANEYGYNAIGNRLFEKNGFTKPSDDSDHVTADVYEYDNLDRVTGTKYGVAATRTSGALSPTNLPDSPGLYSDALAEAALQEFQL